MNTLAAWTSCLASVSSLECETNTNVFINTVVVCSQPPQTEQFVLLKNRARGFVSSHLETKVKNIPTPSDPDPRSLTLQDLGKRLALIKALEILEMSSYFDLNCLPVSML